MKLGRLYEIQIPQPWTEGFEARGYAEAMEQIVLADELGWDYVWAVEHHMLPGWSYSSAPEVFFGALSQRTSRIRIGHGIALLPKNFNHPIRVAERAAVLDILSHGRLEMGTGRSATWTELGGFGADPDETKQTWDEFVRVLPKMWTQERFGYEGRSFSMPSRAILPKPYQKPHPPMWVAVTSPGTEIDAAERGLGALGLQFAGFAAQEQKVNEYRQRIRSCDPVGEFVNEQVATVNFLYCHEDKKTGIERGQGMTGAFNYLAAQLLPVREVHPSRSYPSLGLLPQVRSAVASPGGDDGAPEGLCIGDPDRIIEQIKQWESAGVDRINFLLNAMETIPQEQVLESLRLFASEVMPKFAAKTPIAVSGD